MMSGSTERSDSITNDVRRLRASRVNPSNVVIAPSWGIGRSGATSDPDHHIASGWIGWISVHVACRLLRPPVRRASECVRAVSRSLGHHDELCRPEGLGRGLLLGRDRSTCPVHELQVAHHDSVGASGQEQAERRLAAGDLVSNAINHDLRIRDTVA